MKLRISTTLKWPIARQIPPEWAEQGIQVHINEQVEDCDIWVVYQGIHRPETCRVSPDRVFFFGYEPPGLHDYQPQFLEQFSKVVTCQNVPHPGLVQRHQAQPWLAGVTRSTEENIHEGFGARFTLQDFRDMPFQAKSKRASVVCSKKSMIPGHEHRLVFLQSLQENLSEEMDVFGYGFTPLEDKWEAMAPYHYHLVLENSCVPHYWTEKLADAYLADCMPIVRGCTNLADYFPEESFHLLPADSPGEAVRYTRSILQNPPSDAQREAVREARRRVLETYNLFPEILRLADTPSPAPPQQIRLKDERLFGKGAWIRPFIRSATDGIRYKTTC